MIFKTYRFDDLVEKYIDNRGKTPPLSEQGIPLLEVKHLPVEGKYPSLQTSKRVSEDVYKTWFRSHLEAGDILFSTVGTTGRVGITPTNQKVAIAQNVLGLRFKSKLFDPSYAFYYLRAKPFQNEIESRLITTVQASIKRGDMFEIPMKLPTVQIQKAISSILSTLDDKIENNCRMNETLEEMACTIFKSWFVDFDPVHANAASKSPAFIDTQTAALFPNSFGDDGLPNGWRFKKLRDIAELNPTETIKKGKLTTYVEMANLPTTGSCISNIELREFKSGTKFRNGDTLLARITPCLENGKTAYVDILNDGEVAYGSTEYIVIRVKKPLPKFYSYILARNEHFREHAIRSMTGTSGRQRAQADMVASYEVVMPSKEVALAFSEKCQNLFSKIRCNASENKTLAELRETLLPKLLSGKIRLKDAEHEVEAAV